MTGGIAWRVFGRTASGTTQNSDAVLPSETAKNANSEQTFVLNELIVALMRKRVLRDAEGKALLQKLLR